MKKAIAILAFVSLLWGSEWLLNVSVSGVPRFRFLALRFLVAGLVLLPGAFRSRQSAAAVPIYKSVFLGIVVIVMPTLFLASRTDLSPGLVVVLFTTLPLMTAVLEEGSGLRDAPLLIGGLGGTAFLVRGGLSFSLSQAGPVFILVLLLIALAAILVRAKHWLSIPNISVSVMIQMFIAAAVFSACSTLRERALPLKFTVSELLAATALGIFGGAVAYCSFYWLLCHANPSQATTVQWLVPVVGVIESALRLLHLPAWDSVLGGIVSIISAVLMMRTPIHGDGPLTLQITVPGQPRNASLRSGSG